MCRSRCTAASRWLLAAVLAAFPAGFGSGLAAPPERAMPVSGIPLYLEVVLNGLPTGLIAAFVERVDGGLAIDGAELGELGIRPDPAALAPDGQYDLDAMPGLRYVYDPVQQVVAIDTDLTRLKTRVVSASGASDGMPAAESATGAALNYSLYGNLADHAFAASAALNARAFSPTGLFMQSGIVGYRRGGEFDALRLDTTFQRSDPVTLRTFKAGDFISGGLAWTRPVRLAGVQFARNFALRPDLVTMPLPAFDGSAAVPSTIDVYTNGREVYSTDVPAGPFSITNVPILSNAGTARLVVTDAAGQTVEMSQPFFTSPRLLQAGLLDYSVEAGLPRRNFGRESFDYAFDPAGSVSARYGISDRMTVEGHVEGTSGLVNGGVGLLAPLGGFGLGAVAVAGSAGAGAGFLVSGDLTLQFGQMQMRFASRHTFGAYADIASVTATGGGAGPMPAFDQASLTLPVGGNSATFSATRTVSAEGNERAIVGVSWGRRLPGNASLSLYGYQAFGADPGTGLLFGLSRPLGTDISVSGGTSWDGGRLTGTVEAARGERASGGWGWRVGAGGRREAAEAARVDWQASTSYTGQLARVSAGVRSFDGSLSANAELTGAIAAAGGGLFFSRRFEDAFAVVDVGAPGVTVKSENREIGRTNRDGKLLVPDLRSWQANKIEIAAEDLPLDVEPEATRQVVVPRDGAGVVVDFGGRKLDGAAVVVFRDASGAFIPAGTPGETESGETFFVGYDGETYFRDLKARNRVVIFTDRVGCTATFDHAPRAGEVQPVIEGVICG